MQKCMVAEVRFITNVYYDGGEWMKVRVGGEAQHCACMPTDCLCSIGKVSKWMYLVLGKVLLQCQSW